MAVVLDKYFDFSWGSSICEIISGARSAPFIYLKSSVKSGTSASSMTELMSIKEFSGEVSFVLSSAVGSYLVSYTFNLDPFFLSGDLAGGGAFFSALTGEA